MRTQTHLLPALLVLVGLAYQGAAIAAPTSGRKVATATPGSDKTLGVTASLTTSGYQFNVGPILPRKGPPGTTMPSFIGFGPISFPAAFRLVNHSSADIPFQIPQPKVGPGVMAVMLTRVVFSVYDSAGALVWSSSTNPPDLVYRDIPLSAGSSWQLETKVPLVLNGAFLDGEYTLVAAINGNPEFSATARFKVTKQAITITNDVQGTVLAGPISPVQIPGQPNEGPVAGAVVRYRNAVIEGGPGFIAFQQVIADQNGHFSFNVPTGSYTVIATIPGEQGLSFGTGTQTISVIQGKVTPVTFHLDTGIR